MVACRYEISSLVCNSTSNSFAALTRGLLSQTLEDKFLIYARPCIIILYLGLNSSGKSTAYYIINFWFF